LLPSGPSRTAALAVLVGVLSGWPLGVGAGAQTASPASISLSPPCPSQGPGGAAPTLTVTGSEFHPFTAVLVTFDAGSGGIPESTASRTDGFGRFALDLRPGPRPEGIHTVRADDFRGREAAADVVVPCRPTLVLSPPIGPPGFVTEAIGSGFPAGAAVRLAWTPGISGGRPVVADPAGRFRRPVLVFPNDIRGPRRLRAEPAGTTAFGAAEAPFLVVRRTFVFPGAGG
jgi:hypothetical protein